MTKKFDIYTVVQLQKGIIEQIELTHRPHTTPYNELFLSFIYAVVSEALILTDGNQSEAARVLGLARGTFRKYMKLLKLEHVHLHL